MPRETTPRKRAFECDDYVNEIAEMLLEIAGFKLPANTKIYAVEQRRGFYQPSKKYITIPKWALDGRYAKYNQEGFDYWYIAHELAHAVHCREDFHSYCNDKPHGPEFMAFLKKICPKEYWHYELGYKPRNASAAGISMPKDEL